MKRRLLFLGPPGSGKGTIAARISGSDLGIVHVSSGHLLRLEAESGSELGKRIKQYIDNGDLVPNDIVLALMYRWFCDQGPDSKFILDGFPRTILQAKELDSWLEQKDMPLDSAVFFEISQKEVLDRVTGRRICMKCGQTYHVTQFPPKRAGICDVCGSILVQRPDDSLAAMEHRFDVYWRQTAPLVEYYRNKGILFTIDATRPIEERIQILMNHITEK